MINRSEIREHMDVIASDGSRLGAVDSVNGDRIKLTRKDSPDGQHHYVQLDDIERVDAHVHLRVGRSAVLGGGIDDWGGGGRSRGRSTTKDGPVSPLIKNPAVPHAEPRRNFMLPWVLLGLALLGLLAVAMWGKRDGESNGAAIARDQAAQADPAAGNAGTASPN